jgi:hypothetical protein
MLATRTTCNQVPYTGHHVIVSVALILHFISVSVHSFTLTRLPFASRSIASRQEEVVTATAAVLNSDLVESIREGLQEKGWMEQWDESVKFLSAELDSDADEAEACLADATGWKGWTMCSSPIMRKYMPEPQMPNLATLEDILSWLRDGPLSLREHPDALREAILTYPKVYLSGSVGKNWKLALQTAPPEYKDPDDFQAKLLADPSILQCTFDCSEEGCASECGNCWVSYANKSQ